MKKEQLEQLESLLIELKNEIGAPCIVVPEYLQDGTFLAVYDKDGKAPVFTVVDVNLQACIEKYKMESLKDRFVEGLQRAVKQQRKPKDKGGYWENR